MSFADNLTPPPPDNRLFSVTVGLSLLLHVVFIYLVHFGPVDPRTLFSRRQLDIVLVNARSANAPKNAKLLAQANLEGGGNTDLVNARVSTPLPSQQLEALSSDVSLANQQVKNLEERQHMLLDQLSHNAAVQPEARVQQQQAEAKLNMSSESRQTSEMSSLKGEIDRDVKAYAERPHKAFVGASTKSVVEANYVDKWRTHIEDVGTAHFPTAGNGRLSGVMVVTVEINVNGAIVGVKVDHSSGNPQLDAAAIRIVKMAAPFPPLPRGIVDEQGKPAEILSITRTWYFTHSDIQLKPMT